MNSHLEPTVIDHDPEAYQLWREAQARKVAAAQPPEGHERAVASRAGEAFSWRGERHGHAAGAEASSYDPDAAFAVSYREAGQHQRRRRREGEEYAGEGEGGDREELRPGQPRVGVLDRLGLVSSFWFFQVFVLSSF